MNTVEPLRWDNIIDKLEEGDLKKVFVKSSKDGKDEPCFFYPTSKSEKQALIVSLHTWSGDYTQFDALAKQCIQKDINYIHPNFRGPNWSYEACGSPLAIQDIDDAIQYAIEHGNVDTNNIHIIGCSGGGHMTLMMYMKSVHKIKTFSAWVPISDLIKLYYECIGRKTKYAKELLISTKSNINKEILDKNEARLRSPLFYKTPKDRMEKSNLYLYAGIYDGHYISDDHPLPVSQTMDFYNKLVTETGGSANDLIPENIQRDLLDLRLDEKFDCKKILGDRKVIYTKTFKNMSLDVFDGAHEMLDDYALGFIPL